MESSVIYHRGAKKQTPSTHYQMLFKPIATPTCGLYADKRTCSSRYSEHSVTADDFGCGFQHINFYALHQGLHSTGLNVACLGKLKRHTTSRIVKCIMKGEIPPGESEHWDNEPLQVPSLPPSRLDGCKIIEIFYTVTVRETK